MSDQDWCDPCRQSAYDVIFGITHVDHFLRKQAGFLECNFEDPGVRLVESYLSRDDHSGEIVGEPELSQCCVYGRGMVKVRY